VFRWATKGAHGRVLSSVKIGGIRYTTAESLARFIDQSTPAASSVETELKGRIDQALDEAGL
jgi:hypothetical protein